MAICCRRFIVIAAILALAACGGGGDAVGASGADATTNAPSNGAESGQPAESADPQTTEPTAAPSSGSNESGGALSAALLADPPSTTTTEERPDHTWGFHQALGIVSVGGSTSRFWGVSPAIVPPSAYEGGDTIFDVAGCSFIAATDGLNVVQASFTPPLRDRSSFSMSDNGDGTVTWGYFDATTLEEWSATGPGSARVDFRQFGESVDEGERGSILADLGFVDTFVGDFESGKTLLASIIFEGEASENFSTRKSEAASAVLCLFGSI